MSPTIHRLERFGTVDSTQPIVASWLEEGEPEICVAVADEQTAGRGRRGRGWTAPPGAALLMSIGFRPADLPLRHGWRLGATVALAMAEAAEDMIRRPGAVRLKWPNDLVAVGPDGAPGKLAGVLGETVAAGDLVAHAVVGIGLNVDWKRDDFPPELAPGMSSLRDLAGTAVDREAVLGAFLRRLVQHYGAFDAAAWAARQQTTGAEVDVATGSDGLRGVATGVDADTGALLVRANGGVRTINSGDVVRCRLVVDAEV